MPSRSSEPLAVDGVQHEVVGAGRRVARQEVAQRGVAVGFDRGVQADVLAGQAQQVDHQVDVVAQLGCDLFDLGLATELAFEVAPDGGDLVDLLGDVHGQPHDASLLRDAPRDRLPHPPGGVGRELEALGVVELLDGADEAGVALLHQVEQGHLRAAVLAGDAHDEPEVGGNEAVQGLLAGAGDLTEFILGGLDGTQPALVVADLAGEDRLREESGLDLTGEDHLFLRGQQWRLGDAVEVQADGVAAFDSIG